MKNKLFIANDNAPADAGRARLGLGGAELRHARMTERPSVIVSQPPAHPQYAAVWTPKLQRNKPKRPNPASAATYTLTAMIWVAAILANIAAILFAPSNTVHLVIVIAAIWSSLAMIYVAHSRSKTVLAEMASFCAIAAFGLSLYVTTMRFGIAASPASGAALGAFAAAGLGLITGSKLALRLSAFAALAWAAITLTGSGLDFSEITFAGLPKPGPVWIAFPALLGLQAYAMAKHRDGAALSISVLAAYILALGGIAGLVIAGQFSPLLAAGALLLGGLAHGRMGKLAARKDIFGSTLHAGAGWAAMMAGLLAFQDFWTVPGRALWSGALPAGAEWVAALAAGGLVCGLIFIADIRRAHLSFGTCLSALIMTAMAGGLAYFSARPDGIIAGLNMYGLTASPYIGIAIAGTALTLGLGMMANGFRRNISGFVALGAVAVAASVWLALPAIISSPETGALYALCAFVSALIAASFIRLPDSPAPKLYAPANHAFHNSANDMGRL